jgi:CheY-like chemotaxis protein
MLIDDDRNDNFFHEREIKKNNPEANVIVMETGLEALKYLKSMFKKKDIKPVLIFLDINMPGMNGWEFLDQYSHLGKETQSNVMVIMLTTSDSSESKARVRGWDFVSDYITKPLTKEKLRNLKIKYTI